MSGDTVDLLKEGPQVEKSASPLTTKGFNPDEVQEGVRGKVALILVWTLVAVVSCILLVGFLTSLYCLKSSNACSADAYQLKTAGALGSLILTPLVGLVGAVTGFYFGGKTGSAGRASGS